MGTSTTESGNTDTKVGKERTLQRTDPFTLANGNKASQKVEVRKLIQMEIYTMASGMMETNMVKAHTTSRMGESTSVSFRMAE